MTSSDIRNFFNMIDEGEMGVVLTGGARLSKACQERIVF